MEVSREQLRAVNQPGLCKNITIIRGGYAKDKNKGITDSTECMYVQIVASKKFLENIEAYFNSLDIEESVTVTGYRQEKTRQNLTTR